MSKQLNGCQENTRRLVTQDVQLNSTRLTRATVFHNLCRDQHEISTPPLVHARSGTSCSDVTERKISSPQLRLSSHDTWPSFHTDRMDRAAVQTFVADLMPAIYTIRNRVPRRVRTCLSSFFIGRRHAAFSSISCCRQQSSEMGFANGPPDNTIRITMAIQNQPLVSRSRSIHGNLLLPLQPR